MPELTKETKLPSVLALLYTSFFSISNCNFNQEQITTTTQNDQLYSVLNNNNVLWNNNYLLYSNNVLPISPADINVEYLLCLSEESKTEEIPSFNRLNRLIDEIHCYSKKNNSDRRYFHY